MSQHRLCPRGGRSVCARGAGMLCLVLGEPLGRAVSEHCGVGCCSVTCKVPSGSLLQCGLLDPKHHPKQGKMNGK